MKNLYNVVTNKQTERLNEIAEKVADALMEVMYKSVDWQISDFNTDGDEHYAIHDTVMQLVLKSCQKKYDSKSIIYM